MSRSKFNISKTISEAAIQIGDDLATASYLMQEIDGSPESIAFAKQSAVPFVIVDKIPAVIFTDRALYEWFCTSMWQSFDVEIRRLIAERQG